MNFTKLIPNIFYEDINVGLNLFIECLGFTMDYDGRNEPEPCCVLNSGNLAVFLFQNKEYADKDRPELRLHTDDIEEVYAKISRTHPQLLHPNLNKITLRPWGALEFALADASGVGIRIQQWS